MKVRLLRHSIDTPSGLKPGPPREGLTTTSIWRDSKMARRCEIPSWSHGVIASFSRALTEGLTAQQSDEEFNATLDAAIAEIAKASAT